MRRLSRSTQGRSSAASEVYEGQVSVKPVRELTQREIGHDNPEFRLVEDTLHFLSHIYSREVALDDAVSVIHFSEVIEFPSLK